MNKNYLETFPIIMPEMISGMFDIFEQFNNSIFNKATIKKFFPYPINIYNIIDTKQNKNLTTVIEIALAGFNKDEISVKAIKGKSLTVKLTPHNEEIYKEGVIRKNLTYGIAKREASITWSLNAKVDLEKFKTIYKNGILTIYLPLKEEKINEEEIVSNIIEE
jgi:HSP20 family molecular chaperone IbpA